MIPCLTRSPFAAVSVIAALLTVGCEKAPLLAPTGSSITLTSGTNAIPANGSATIVAQVLEAAGTPPHSGTRVTFTTTLGVIEPPEASTDASGRTSVTFRASGASGVAVISASSGGATTGLSGGSSSGTGTGSTAGTTGSSDRNLRIAVGAAAVGRVNLSATPTILPTNGGTTTVLANVLDINGNALSAAVVSFTTTAGNLSSSSATTDANGNALVTLTTFQQATVTATVGVTSSNGGSTGTGTGGSQGSSPSQATVTVSLTAAPTASITPPTTLPSAGLPGSYTIKVTPATATGSGGGGTGGGTGGSTGGTVPIREVLLAWGDGLTENLGAVSGEQAVSHIYARPGTYSISLNVTDVAGGTARVSTSVTVIQVPPPTINITYSPVPARINTQTTINVLITPAPGLAIVNLVIDFGDGTSAALGGGTSAQQPHVYTAVGTYTVRVLVTDSAGQTNIGTTSLSVTGP